MANNTAASAYVKAAVRDSKAYIKPSNYRSIGVGYATNDDPGVRTTLADYFNCDPAASDSIDFWGYNIYSWCGDFSYQQSGYENRTIQFSNYSVPAFFSEYGWNKIQPRTFSEVDTIFGPNMTEIWSGGIVYMYFEEANDYDLVDVSDGSITTLSAFSYLSNRMLSPTPTGIPKGSYTPANSPQACPTIDGDWQAVASPLPPTPDSDICQCVYSSLSCVPKNTLSTNQEPDLFGIVCGLSSDACSKIRHNATTGRYGTYSMCNSTVQLAVALDAYYKQQGSQACACKFDGSPVVQKSRVSCSSVLPGISGPSSSASASKSSNGGPSHVFHHDVDAKGFFLTGYVAMVSMTVLTLSSL